MYTFFNAAAVTSGKSRLKINTPVKEAMLHYLLWTIVGIGIFLRVFHYLDNRSFWIDELFLTQSLIELGFAELATEVLAYEQKAPIGFLWLVKLSIMLFGHGEKAFRLVPLLGGIGSVLLFVPLARHYLKPLGMVLAIGIIALAPDLVYHATELKQYSTELFASVLVLYLFNRYQGRLDYRSRLLWGLWGALIVWFSFTSIIIMASVAIGISLYYMLQKDWKNFFRFLLPFSLWLLSFAINYFLFTDKHTDSDWLIEWFRYRNGFMPNDASIFDIVKWLSSAFYKIFIYPLGVLWNAEILLEIENPVLRILPKMLVFFILFWLAGLYFIYKRDKKIFLVFLLPPLLLIVAALIEKYPLYERMMVFLAPIPIILMALGCERLTHLLKGKTKARFLLPIILIGWPAWVSANQLIDTDSFGGYKNANYRDGLLFLSNHLQEGDVVLLYWNMKPHYYYYNKEYKLNLDGHFLPDERLIAKDQDDYIRRLRAAYMPLVSGKKRVWFVYDAFLAFQIGDYDEKPVWYMTEENRAGKLIERDLSITGKKIKTYFKSDNIGISLYDFSSSDTRRSSQAGTTD